MIVTNIGVNLYRIELKPDEQIEVNELTEDGNRTPAFVLQEAVRKGLDEMKLPRPTGD